MTSLVPHLPHNARRRPSRSSQTDDRLPRPSSPRLSPTPTPLRPPSTVELGSPASHLGEKPGRFFGDGVGLGPAVGTELQRSGSRRSCRVGGSLTEEDEDEEVEWGYPEGGRGWWVVLGCFLYAGCNMGWGLVWGVFQTNFAANVFTDTPESTLTLIGGLAAFSSTATSFVAGRLGDRYGYKRMIIVANIFTFIAFLLSSFCTKLWQVFVCQGFLIGTGLGLSMPLYMALPSQWFLKKRGLATGIAVSGASFFGGIDTIILRLLIVKIGYKHTLLIYTFILSTIWTFAWFLLKVRTPPRKKQAEGEGGDENRPWLPKGCWTNPTFYSLMGCIFIATFGFLTPFYYITTYTKDEIPELANSTTLRVTIPLLVMNLSGAVGRVLAGLVADNLGPVNIFTTSLFLAGLVQLVMWEFAHTYNVIVGFSVLYGFVASIWMSLLPVVVAQLFGVDDLATLTGFAVLINSPGQFVGSTIAGSIKTAADGRYQPMIIFSGGMTVVGSLFMLYARFKGEKRIWAAY